MIVPRRFSVIICVLLLLVFVASRFVASRSNAVSAWESWENECRRLRDNHEWTDLTTASERWSSAYPARAEPWLYRAEAADGLQDFEKEAEYLERVPESDPRAIDAFIRKGRLEFEPLNRPWASLRTCDRILQLDSRVLSAHQQSIYFCALTLQRREMIHRIRTAIRARRESPQSYLLLAGASWYILPETYQANTHWLKADPDCETFDVARAMHVYESESKRHSDLAPLYAHIPEPEELRKKYPQNIELLAYFLRKRITAGDVDEVQQILSTIPQSEIENDARLCRAFAWVLDNRGEPDEAERYLRKGISLDPYMRNTLYDLSELLRRTNRQEEAEKIIKIHEMAINLAKTIGELKDPFDSKFLQEMKEFATVVGDADVVIALSERLDRE